MGGAGNTTGRRYSVYASIGIFLFGGIIFLLESRNVSGVLLLALGGLNVLSMLIRPGTNNRFFFVLYLVNSFFALYVSYYYYFSNSRYVHLAWLAIAVVFFIVSIFYFRKAKKRKADKG